MSAFGSRTVSARPNYWLEETRAILDEDPGIPYRDLAQDLADYRMLAANPETGEAIDFAVEVLSRLANLEEDK